MVGLRLWLTLALVMLVAVDAGSDPAPLERPSRPSHRRSRTRTNRRRNHRNHLNQNLNHNNLQHSGVSGGRRRGQNRAPANLPAIDETLNRIQTNAAGEPTFEWNGREYVVGGHRIVTRKKTKTTTTSHGADGSVVNLPGSTHVTTTIRNRTFSHSPRYPGDHINYVVSQSSSSSSSSSAASSSSGSSSSGHVSGAVVEGMVYDYEEEVDPGFASRGYKIPAEQLRHPFDLARTGYSRVSTSCERRSCYPATGNLLIGREERLTSTSTCGLQNKEKFCIVSHLQDRKKCFWCDSRPEQRGKPRFSHTIDNIIYKVDTRTGQRTWWQSENGRQTASVQLNLEAEFHVTHLIITFRTFRPAAMLIERSFDFGKTWKVYKYFAYNCGESFPGIKRGPRTNISDIVCESRYSSTEPSTEGEVIFRVMPPNIRITNPYSEDVQNLLKITNLRVNFTKLHTLGDQLLDTRPEIKEKYYYSIYEMVVRGSCSCYGHASRCLPLPGVPNRPNMVHGRCECTHNTVGLNCEKCQDFYHDLPWRPAVVTESNACKKCNCNNHSTRCYFDPSVYEETGRVSGGVCQDCQHHTQGRNCQECLPYYFQEPGRDLRDPNICQPCRCDERGSVNEGICESHSDASQGLEAGRCHCKANVHGLKCDGCKAGYWNFTSENPLGCQDCTCNTLGTQNNQGCDVNTGECQCKRNVIGRDCNQCLPQHYQLSEHPDGCKACDCDRGGALDDDCDVITGQCKCRPHVVGRRCDQPEEGFYVPSLNYLTYEAELANGSENCQVVLREPPPSGGAHWTGLGFMRVVAGSQLEFDIENIETSMEYDLVLRYEPQYHGQWDNVVLKVERFGAVDPTGPCRNVRPINDERTLVLRGDQRHETLFPPVCLEEGRRYKVHIEFKRSLPHQDTPSASILIDSIMLIPRTENLPFYTGAESDDLRQEFEYYRCRDNFYNGQLSTVPELCREDHLDSIGFYVYGQAFACECDPTGAESNICSTLGGACPCKRNVAGRRCDRCAPGTWGLGPSGCAPCECNPVGALDNFCNVHEGKCKCRPNTYGRQCDQCQPGYWNFPNCQRCECNGHADDCDSVTGACLECDSFTDGNNCDTCVEGYYGDPRLGPSIPCRPCPCPGDAKTGHSFASRCHLDPETRDVVCECQEGYLGPRCSQCADNYHGLPALVGGVCRPCDCSGNTDLSFPGNCRHDTGACLRCLFHTSGQNCGRCMPGYYGDALSRTCQSCTCNLLGSEPTEEVCDHVTGKCPCRPNVIGLSCEQCSENHWRIASGEGCDACACDAVGSVLEQCNEFDGQCQCKEGFGGRRCNQCQTYFYGDPRSQCMPCNCNHEGSLSHQCDPETGHCDCKEGIGGHKCDRCARGYSGEAPYCKPCGECFDNWDFILDALKDRTATLIESAKQIRRSGATGAYKTEFSIMEDRLDDVRNILDTANTTSQDLVDLTKVIDELMGAMEGHRGALLTLEGGVDNTTQRISLAKNTLATLRAKAETLRNDAADLKKKGTKLQEANVEGALNSTRHSDERSQKALNRAMATTVALEESKRNRRRTDNRLLHSANMFNLTHTDNNDMLDMLAMRLQVLNGSMPDMNEVVCDGRGDPCDALCGGAGCGRCGSLSCNKGLVETSTLGLKISGDAETILKKKEAATDDLLRGISAVKRHSDIAAELARQAHNASLFSRDSTDRYGLAVDGLLANISDYFDGPRDAIEAIRLLSEETRNLNIKLRPAQITQLSDDIRRTIKSLTDIEKILHETSNDLQLATELKARADAARSAAERTLAVAEQVVAALAATAVAQQAATGAIGGAAADIAATREELGQISEETQAATRRANASFYEVEAFEQRVKDLKYRYSINRRHLEDTKAAVEQANSKAYKASNDALGLEDRYNEVVRLLAEKSSAAEANRQRAEAIMERSNKLAAEAYASEEMLKDIMESFAKSEATFEDYESQLRLMEETMEVSHTYIMNKAEFYATCTSGKRK